MSKQGINLDPEGFPYRLRTIRAYRHLKQIEVAQALGISATVYSSWERGSHLPRGSNYTKLAQIFDVPLELLIDGPKNGESIEDYLQFALSKHFVSIIEAKDLSLTSNLGQVIEKSNKKTNFSIIQGLEKDFKEQRVFLYRIDDDLMTSSKGRTLNSGMIAIIVNTQDVRVYNGKAVLLAVEGEEKATIRELAFDKAELVLKCWNPKYAEKRINLRQKKVNIFGYVAIAFEKFF